MTCPTCTPAKRCDSCERVAIVAPFVDNGFGRNRTEEKALRLLVELDAHDRARLAAPEMVERVARAIFQSIHPTWNWQDASLDTWDWYKNQAKTGLAAITEAK